MMRISRLLITIVGLLCTTPSFASVYYIDLNNPVGVTTSPTAYDVYAPVHAAIQAYLTPVFHLHAGDQVDFGTVTIDPVFSGDGRYNIISLFYFSPTVGVSFDATQPPNPFYAAFQSYFYCTPIDQCTWPNPPKVDSQTFDLLFTLQSDTIQLSFSGPFTYEAPAIAAAVPEPSTWAMVLIGFVVIGLFVRRRNRCPVHGIAYF
jgi:hypothetical protein